MKFLLGVLVALTTTLLGCASSQADPAYYFAANGSDRKPCTQTLPCRTIAKAQSLSYLPGDSINFRGGDTFTGCLSITPTNVPSGGLPSNPITVQSYGTGSATLTNDCTGDRTGLVTIDGVSGVIVNNLKIAVSPSITLGAGVLVQNSFSLNPVSTVIVQNSEITGAHTTGALAPDPTSEVLILGWANHRKCGPLTNIQVLNNKLHGATPTSTDGNGITGTGCDSDTSHNISNTLYSGNEVYNVQNGIVISGVDGGVAQFNLVHDVGANNVSCGGPVGVWAWRSNNATIQFNEVHHVQPLPSYPGGGACDWDAYDLDVGVTNSVVQYNYSHDNAGPCLLAYNAEVWGNNTFRYNICENDNTTLSTGNGLIFLMAPTGTGGDGIARVYNNTIFNNVSSPTSSAPPACLDFGFSGTFPAGTLVANNICINSGTDQYGRTRFVDYGNGPDTTQVTLTHNLYFGPGTWNWGLTDYSVFADYQTASGKDAGSVVGDPNLAGIVPAGACTWTPSLADGPQPCPSGYELTAAPVLNAGANLQADPYNLDVGTRDYWGNAITTTPNIGADGGPH